MEGGRARERERGRVGVRLGYHINDCYQKGYAQPILRLYMHASWYKKKVETDVKCWWVEKMSTCLPAPHVPPKYVILGQISPP